MTLEEMEISRYKSMIVAMNKAIETPHKKSNHTTVIQDRKRLKILELELEKLEKIFNNSKKKKEGECRQK